MTAVPLFLTAMRHCRRQLATSTTPSAAALQRFRRPLGTPRRLPADTRHICCGTAGFLRHYRAMRVDGGEAAVNGDEVRRLIFPRGKGYDTAAVEELLDRVATGLDAGRPVAPLIEDATFPRQGSWSLISSDPLSRKRGGYDWADVDGVLSQLRRQDDPAARADPWRDLPAWRYRTASQAAGVADPAAPAGRRAALPRAARVQAAKDYARACADAWRDFGLQPGTQLSLVKTGVACRELRTAGQDALASVRYEAFSRDGRAFKWSGVEAAQWPAVAAELGARRPDTPACLPRTAPAPRTGKEAPRQDAVARKP